MTERRRISGYADWLLDFLVPFGPILRLDGGRPTFRIWPRVLYQALPTSFFAFWLSSLIPVIGVFFYTLIMIPLAIRRHLSLVENPEPWHRVALIYYVVILIGFGGVWSFVGHTFLADTVAAQIGWATGSPFQTEIAFATLGAALVGLLAIWVRDNLVTGLVIAKSVFWLGAAGVHIRDAIEHANYSPLNIGAPLIGDIIYPALLMWLLWKGLQGRMNE
jgi:hypothetical protein